VKVNFHSGDAGAASARDRGPAAGQGP